MLAEIKNEYEWALDMAANGGPSAARPDPPPLHPLPPLHQQQLQMPAAYYEQQWRRCQNERASSSRTGWQRLRRMVKSLRGGAIEAVDRLQYAGGEKTQTPSSPGPGGMMSTASSQSWRGGGSGGGGAYPTIREDEEADDLRAATRMTMTAVRRTRRRRRRMPIRSSTTRWSWRSRGRSSICTT